MAGKRNTGKHQSSTARTSIKKNDTDPSTPTARGGMRGERRLGEKRWWERALRVGGVCTSGGSLHLSRQVPRRLAGQGVEAPPGPHTPEGALTTRSGVAASSSGSRISRSYRTRPRQDATLQTPTPRQDPICLSVQTPPPCGSCCPGFTFPS